MARIIFSNGREAIHLTNGGRCLFGTRSTSRTKIERGRRPMEVSELVAFATALDVPPAALFLPLDTPTVSLTEEKTVLSGKGRRLGLRRRIRRSREHAHDLLESQTFSVSGYGRAGAGGSGTSEKVTA